MDDKKFPALVAHERQRPYDAGNYPEEAGDHMERAERHLQVALHRVRLAMALLAPSLVAASPLAKIEETLRVLVENANVGL